MKIYDYIIHLPNKIFYPFLVKDKKIYENFQKNGYYHFHDEADNIKLSRYVEENIDVKDSISKNLFSSGYEHYIKYGYKENRICTPLVDEIHYIKLDDSIYTPADENLGLIVNKIFIFIYSHLDKLSPYIIIFGLIFLFYKKLYLELLISGGLLSIFILRLVIDQ